ncbi:predicted metal-dependent protease [Erythrobacter litoralis HTCC2594]|uniref:Predicted metal-dependent protease n=1 Tax=Erythrobacter litoralis (strain HTCC2594) TaxID=314225 RepID=Q2NDB2_ERYLH|nr:predicted metal-dependent protease [Erythrobacter litoralis HTCC2594]
MLTIEASVMDALLAETSLAHPLECCGILLGEHNHITAIQPAANVHPQPQTHFEIDPQTLVDAHRAGRNGGPQVLGYYHSHPTTVPEPSATDAAMAAQDGSIWAIIGQGEIIFWRDRNDGFAQLSYSILDG